MPHVSSKDVERRWEEELRKLFTYIVTSAPSERARGEVIDELLTETEQVMLAKRIACLAMLQAGFSSYTIRIRLRISTSTIKRYRRAVDGGAYADLLRRIAAYNTKEQFWADMDTLSRGGLPPIAGKKARPSPWAKRHSA